MARETNIILNPKSTYALRHQKSLGQYDFPFTMNPTMGCFFGCKYCYSPGFVYPYLKNQKEQKLKFFENVYVKGGQPQWLAEELPRYAPLPPHLKRVQINESSEYYLPQLLKHLEDQKQPDIMLGILAEFEKAWNGGNKWMLHILTKSHLILNHIDKLKQMKQMIQIEVSFATHDENIRSQIEYYTPSIKKRLDLIESLSKEGIFVRVMAMPFYGNRDDLISLKNEAFNRGAKAFKNKSLNYYTWEDLVKVGEYGQFIEDTIPRNEVRSDNKDESMMIKSGEYVINEGKNEQRDVLFPVVNSYFYASKDWSFYGTFNDLLEQRSMKVIDCGYADCNSESWGYII